MGLKQLIKRMIPVSWVDYQRRLRYSLHKSKSKFKDKPIKDTFTEIYKTNHWNSDASISGTGSDMEQTRVVRQTIPQVIRDFGIKSMLDVPCGDFNWMKEVDLSGIDYLGGDIVEELVEENKRKYSKPNIRFEVIDLTTSNLPKVDLIFCRDALVHLSYDYIFKALANIKASGSKYLLTTSFTERDSNYDIVTGDWRTLNLRKPPFNFPAPIKMINEECTEGGTDYFDKSIGLWKIADLPVPELVK